MSDRHVPTFQNGPVEVMHGAQCVAVQQAGQFVIGLTPEHARRLAIVLIEQAAASELVGDEEDE